MISSGVDRRGQPGVGDVHAVASPSPPSGAADEGGRVAGLELDDALAQLADAQLRAGQVLQDRDLAAGAAGGVADAARGLRVLVGAAVGEVQAGDVHPGLDDADEHLGIARGGPDGGDDLRPALHQRRTIYRATPTQCAVTDVSRSWTRRVGQRGRGRTPHPASKRCARPRAAHRSPQEALPRVLKRTFKQFGEDQLTTWAAALTYSACCRCSRCCSRWSRCSA